MTKEERIKLRNELFEELKQANVIINTAKCNNNVRVVKKDKRIEILNQHQQLLQKYDMYIDQFSSEDEGLYCLTHLDDSSNHLCPVCGNVCTFYDGHPKKYRRTCGNKDCSMSLSHTEDTIIKSKQTKLKNYGNENYTNREKAKLTNIEKYGAENPFASKIIQDKIKQTNLEKFGVENVSQNKEIQEKKKQTNLERFGVEYALQSSEVREKGKLTNLKKFGVENVSQNKEIQEKKKQTNLERFGVPNAMQSEEIKQKAIQTNLKKRGYEYGFISNDGVNYTQAHITNYDIWMDDNKFKEFIIDKYNEKGTFLMLNDINKHFNVYSQAIKSKIESLNLLDYFYIQQSNLEIQFKDFLDSYHIKYHQYDRNIIYPKEIDFLLIDNNIGIEINDISTHNIANKYNTILKRDKYYHLNKTISAKEKGIRLIHLWEWELRNEDEWIKISNWILNLLNTNKIKIGARKCIIKEVSLEEEKKFLNQYHLQGYMKSEVCYGLYYDDELIQLMSFSIPRYNKNYQYELLRLCTKYSYIVIGGTNKLLKRFIKDSNSKSIISYCNLDKFDGKVYEELGFKLLKSAQPQIIWCNKEMKHFSQSSLNMIGADKIIGTNFGKGTDNEEIVLNHGYVPIYNCGLNVYVYN